MFEDVKVGLSASVGLLEGSGAIAFLWASGFSFVWAHAVLSVKLVY